MNTGSPERIDLFSGLLWIRKTESLHFYFLMLKSTSLDRVSTTAKHSESEDGECPKLKNVPYQEYTIIVDNSKHREDFVSADPHSNGRRIDVGNIGDVAKACYAA